MLVDEADTGVAFVGSGGGEVQGGDEEGDFGAAEGAGVDREVEVVAAEDVAGRAVGAGAVALAGVGIGGVLAAAVVPGAGPGGFAGGLLAAPHRSSSTIVGERASARVPTVSPKT
ncbi:hypothetical protein ACIBCM_30500 [Streptomyces sp. NPDC051018]|uniref:hypothetical protein n=1 Tax=Streptomyces sp. NPDC051018 TaxID=3365639 RepID=UPI0037BDD9F2